ncbi:Protein of unknown function [Shimia gijangensis]|uniref:DUF2924 domain-containing protein n=1 Tax=Shimia gijangensis TaxID=1470563 RepID=A0A1M6SQT1_9RHOB|nr:DUF2924 domain-containing protein [Shimia gijangensis]SHK47102.1 Protein of unknown function [Shimia gijangensis]
MRTKGTDLDIRLLEDADAATLRGIWADANGTASPKTFTARLMRLALAWEVQADCAARETTRVRRGWKRVQREGSKDRAKGLAENAKAPLAGEGTRIFKHWAEATHEVLITENGAAIWNGQSYSSLSAVARAMTGTNRNGPKFFGLREGGKR